MQSTKTLISITTQLKLFCAVLILATLATTETNAQTLPNTLDLGSSSGINLNLIFPTTIDGKTYYYLDHAQSNRATSGDNVTHVALNNLLNDGNDTKDSQDGAHDGRDDERSAIGSATEEDFTLILPTQAEFEAFPDFILMWEPIGPYWASTPGVDDGTFITRNIFNSSFSSASGTEERRVVFQVLRTPPPSPLTFETDSIDVQFYNSDTAVNVTLPRATGGIGALTYSLTPKMDIPDGLSFNSDSHSLTGTPTATATAVTIPLTYMVTDSATPPANATLTFVVTVDAFITTWETRPGQNIITIPIHAESSYRYTVNWGDDTEDPKTYTSTIPATHEYPNRTDNYKVTITGVFPRIFFNDGSERNKIISIDQWGSNRWSSMENAFTGCRNLRYNADDTPDLSQVTDMSHMFRLANVFNGDIGDWDVSNVTNMERMFTSAFTFNQDIGDWDVSEVTTMTSMFLFATAFDQDIGRWDVSQVTDMTGMLGSVTLSTDNYDALLAGWSKLELRSGVPFSPGNSQHCNQPAKDILTKRYNWDITRNNPADNCSLTFGTETIPDQNYNVNRTVSVTLTEAYGGTPPLEYTLTPEMDIPDDLSFTTATRTLAGTPTTTAAVTLTYTVTDSATPMPTTTTLTFMVTVAKRQQTGFGFANTAVTKLVGDDPFRVTLTGGSGSGMLTYESSDITVATVDADGEVTIVAVGSVIITATKAADDDYNQATATYTLTVTVPPSAFVTTWAIPPAEPRITIPTLATTENVYNYHVHWGDGETTGPHTGDTSHTYEDVGENTRTYTVTLTGDFPRIYFDGGGDKDKIISIDQWGTIPWSSMEKAFRGCSNLRYTATDNPDLSRVTSMVGMFDSATVFNGNIGGWDVSKVIDMSSMFSGATQFDQNIGAWDVSKVDMYMTNMFARCYPFYRQLRCLTGRLEQVNIAKKRSF